MKTSVLYNEKAFKDEIKRYINICKMIGKAKNKAKFILENDKGEDSKFLSGAVLSIENPEKSDLKDLKVWIAVSDEVRHVEVANMPWFGVMYHLKSANSLLIDTAIFDDAQLGVLILDYKIRINKADVGNAIDRIDIAQLGTLKIRYSGCYRHLLTVNTVLIINNTWEIPNNIILSINSNFIGLSSKYVETHNMMIKQAKKILLAERNYVVSKDDKILFYVNEIRVFKFNNASGPFVVTIPYDAISDRNFNKLREISLGFLER